MLTGQAPNIEIVICFLDISLMEFLRNVNAFLFFGKYAYVSS